MTEPIPTTATIDWGRVIINERPESMTFEDYKLHQKAYKYLMKLRKSQGIEIKGLMRPINESETGTSLDQA
jgi:hypothetical protein